MQKQKTLFQHVKQFINERYDGPKWFTTQQMRNAIGHYENRTSWKRYSKNPNYVMHIYVGYLRKLGCITRTKRGHYKINAPIPQWFGSYHFDGLKGRLDDSSNIYWNTLPSEHQVNPWAKKEEEEPQARIEDVLMGLEEETIRVKFPANVEGSIEFNSANTDSLDDRIYELEQQIASHKRILNTAEGALLRLLRERDSQVYVHHRFGYETDVYSIETASEEYMATITYNPDDMKYDVLVQTEYGGTPDLTPQEYTKLAELVKEKHKLYKNRVTW